MIEDKDYVLKLVRRLAEVLASAFRKREEQKHEQALQELEAAYRDFFGIDARFVHLMHADAVRAMLRHPTRIEAFADLLREHAKVLEEVHDARALLLARLADALGGVR